MILPGSGRSSEHYTYYLNCLVNCMRVPFPYSFPEMLLEGIDRRMVTRDVLSSYLRHAMLLFVVFVALFSCCFHPVGFSPHTSSRSFQEIIDLKVQLNFASVKFVPRCQFGIYLRFSCHPIMDGFLRSTTWTFGTIPFRPLNLASRLHQTALPWTSHRLPLASITCIN